jgi:hypothetical protein
MTLFSQQQEQLKQNNFITIHSFNSAISIFAVYWTFPFIFMDFIILVATTLILRSSHSPHDNIITHLCGPLKIFKIK